MTADHQSDRPPRRSSDETRELVLEVVHDLFYWQGIRATGVDTIAAKAGIAPTTLYRLYPSKDALIAAYVERAGRLYRGWFTAAAQAGGASPRGRILAVFDALVEQTQPENCRGCPFLMAMAEIPDRDDPAHQHAVAVKAWVRDQFAELASGLAGSDPGELGDQLALIMEGVYASVQALGTEGPAGQARTLVARLLDGR